MAKRKSTKGQEEFEDTKGVIWIRISKKNRQHNDQKKKDKQRSTKHTHKTKDRVTRTPLKTRRVNLVANPVISHEWGKDREVLTTSGTYPWSFVTKIFHNGQSSHGGDRKLSKWWLQLNQEEPLVQ
jgi:hypothetical protein